MYFKKCEKNIGVGAQSPLCNAEQNIINPFVVLGDVAPNENDDSIINEGGTYNAVPKV